MSDSDLALTPDQLRELRSLTTSRKLIKTLEYRQPRHHWQSPERASDGSPWFQRVFIFAHRLLFSCLCFMAFGHSSLGPLWSTLVLEHHGDEAVWQLGMRAVWERLNGLILVAGLLLASVSAFITTEPAKESIAPYTLRGPFICLLGAFALLLGGIIVGSAALMVIGKIYPAWLRDSLMSSRWHIYAILILLSYPFMSIGIATLLFASGLLASVWCTADRGVQGASLIVVVFPVSMAFFFALACMTAKDSRQNTPHNHSSATRVDMSVPNHLHKNV